MSELWVTIVPDRSPFPVYDNEFSGFLDFQTEVRIWGKFARYFTGYCKTNLSSFFNLQIVNLSKIKLKVPKFENKVSKMSLR